MAEKKRRGSGPIVAGILITVFGFFILVINAEGSGAPETTVANNIIAFLAIIGGLTLVFTGVRMLRSH
ncbi:MAG TPA: hypothetical protein ENI11_03515 [Actinobacteria bacterium]|nr:hypothetical protein [Actinomycetota bacterium]